ncbi:uncharacterized protein LOC103579019 [Microplitis demolitor]|uniref:uncharacterized protein LOC103579019 n=1 Tax=Microplitis demolitor TaxID=69319 RepID=UPI0004CCCAB6|nr:uncharacterized protein LOC103579019 [Microplitis demolitor]
MTVGGKILITSKRSACEFDILRKPTKGCYCVNNNQNKLKLKSISTTVDNHLWPCDYCKSNFNVKLSDFAITDDAKINPPSPAESTFTRDLSKKVYEISNYIPRSEFLRNVKNKLSKNYNYTGKSKSQMFLSTDRQKSFKKSHTEDNYFTDESANFQIFDPKTINSAENNSSTPKIKTIFTSAIPSYRKTSMDRLKSKKTIRSLSKLNSRQQDKRSISKTSLLDSNNKTPRVIVQNNCDYESCFINTRGRNLNSRKQTCCKCGGKQSSLLSINNKNDPVEKETFKLDKFRKINYFDTHGSSHTLLSIESPAELVDQYKLNDRLFLEPVDKINPHDLVVSLPITKNKNIQQIAHYFPRNIIVDQYCKDNKKKHTHKKSPLTEVNSHLELNNLISINKKPPLSLITNNNSLALRFQKKKIL